MPHRSPSGRAWAALACALLASCTAELPHRWIDPARGIEFHSDFGERQVRMLYDASLAARIDRLAELFEQPSLQGLRVYVHDRQGAQFGDATAAGWHGGGEIHVMATLFAGLPFPSFESARTFDHELVHALVQRSGLELPRWFEEGLCEVLSASPLDATGRLVPIADGEREAEVRRMLRDRQLLSGEELLACTDRYPADKGAIAAMYAQGTSFVWHLLEGRLPTRARIAELAALPRAQLLESYAAWERALPQTSIAALLENGLAAGDPAVRAATVRELANAPRDEPFWRAVAPLLLDADGRVRAAARLTALYRPPPDEDTRRRFSAWRDGSDDGLRTAACLALAQLGDATALRDFLRAAAEGAGATGDESSSQGLVWIRLLLPFDGVSLSPPLDGGRDGERAFAAALLQQFDAQSDVLVWHRDGGRFVRRAAR